MRQTASLALLALLLAAGGCSTAYYAAAEQIGFAPHDALANRIQQAKDAVKEAASTVRATAHALHGLAEAPENQRPARLRDVQTARAEAGDQAAEVAPRLAAVSRAGEALFDEWTSDVAAESDADQRAHAQAQVAVSQQHYARVVEALEQARQAITAVLAGLDAHIAPLAEHLDSGAIAGLQAALPTIDAAINALGSDVDVAAALSTKYVTELELND